LLEQISDSGALPERELAGDPADWSVSPAQLEAIRSVSATVAQGTGLQETLDVITRTATELSRSQAAAVILRQTELGLGLSVASSYGLRTDYAEYLNQTRPLEIGQGPSGLAIKRCKAVMVADFLTDPIAAPWRDLSIREHYRSLLSLPLRESEGQALGVLNIYRALPGAWDADHLAIMAMMADHAAIAIRTARLLDEARRQVDGLSLMVRSLHAQGHEHSNRLHAIYGLLTLGLPHEATNLIAEVEGSYHSMYGSVTQKIQNSTLAGFLVAESAIARESSIEFKLDSRSRIRELPTAVSDLDAITVIGNLVHNAVEAVSGMPRSRRRIAVGLFETDSETIFRVRDWGPGIPNDDLDRVLEAEFTTKPGHNGIGLALIKNIVNRAGGEITLSLPPSKGLSVTVRFPR
jgi:signal transduction histidine kinase